MIDHAATVCRDHCHPLLKHQRMCCACVWHCCHMQPKNLDSSWWDLCPSVQVRALAGRGMGREKKPGGCLGYTLVMPYFDLSSYLYLSRLIHDMSLIIPKLSVLLACLYCLCIHTHICVNTYQTYLLSRYLATILSNTHTESTATAPSYSIRYSYAYLTLSS